jgi:prophage regulatory protein
MKIIRRKEVQERTGLSRSTIYLRISKGLFPKQISLGDRACGWLESDINNWIENCITTSSNKKERSNG